MKLIRSRRLWLISYFGADARGGRDLEGPECLGELELGLRAGSKFAGGVGTFEIVILKL